MEHTSTGIYLTDDEIKRVLFALQNDYNALRLERPPVDEELLEEYAALIVKFNKYWVKSLDNDR